MELTGLERVDWRNLTSAYGTSENVPEMLLGLVSSNADHRETAIQDLFGTIWHQGTVYEATAYAVPFLIQIAGNAEVPDREHVISLLQVIAEGTGYVQVHRQLMRGEKDDSELDRKEAQERVWVAAARQAVVGGLVAYLALLTDRDAQIRIAVPYLLATIHESTSESWPRLESVSRSDTDPRVRASAWLALGMLGRRAEKDDLDQVATSEVPLVQAGAAIASALVATTNAHRDFAASAVSRFLPEAWNGFRSGPWEPAEMTIAALMDEPELQLRVIGALAVGMDPAARAHGVGLASELLRSRRGVAQDVVQLLGKALSDSAEAVRVSASVGLDYAFPLCRPVADQMLAALPGDEKSGWHLVVTLSRLQDKRIVPAVAGLFRSPDPPKWIGSALLGLGPLAVGSLEDVVRLIRQLPSASPGGAIDNRLLHFSQWIGGIGESAAPAVSTLAWMIENGRAAIGAAYALAKLGPTARPALPTLMKFAETPDRFLRPHVLAGIWRIAGNSAPLVAAVSEALNLGERMQEWWAYAEELGPEMGPLLPVLLELSTSDDEWIAVPAARVIWRATGSIEEPTAILAKFAGPRPAGMRALEALAEAGVCTDDLSARLRPLVESDFRPHGLVASLNEVVERDERFRALAGQVLAGRGPT